MCPVLHILQTTVLVEPILRLGEEPLHLSGLCLQSHIPACMGPLEHWWEVLEVASEAGYNMIHLCPPQVRALAHINYAFSSNLKANCERIERKRRRVREMK